MCIFAVFSLNHFKKFKLIYFIAFKMFPWQNDVLEIKKKPIYIQYLQIDIFHHRKIWSKPLCIRSENFIRIEQAFYVNWCALFLKIWDYNKWKDILHIKNIGRKNWGLLKLIFGFFNVPLKYVIQKETYDCGDSFNRYRMKEIFTNLGICLTWIRYKTKWNYQHW